MSHHPAGEPFLDERTVGHLRLALWLGCAAVYTVTLIAGISAGGTDLLVVARALGSALVLAVLGRLAVAFLAEARRAVDLEPETDLTSEPSLADLLAPLDAGSPAEPPDMEEDQQTLEELEEELPVEDESLFNPVPGEA